MERPKICIRQTLSIQQILTITAITSDHILSQYTQSTSVSIKTALKINNLPNLQSSHIQ